MIKRKLTELTMPLKTYLQMLVTRCGEEPERLPGEIELGRRFSLSRPTVHGVLEELETEHYVQLIPGKRGYYSNPDQRVVGQKVIAILSTNADARFSMPNYIEAIAGGIQDERTFLHFVQLRPGSEEELYAQLHNFDYSGILWSDPDPRFFPVIHRLIADGVPIVASFLYGTTSVFPERNIVLLDISDFVKRCWAVIREKKYHHVLYYTKCEYFFQCHKKMASDGVRYEWLESAEDLKHLYENDPPDMILADGGNDRYRELFHVLESWNGPLPDVYYYFQKVPLMSSLCEKKFKGHFFPVPLEKEVASGRRGFLYGKTSIRKLKDLMKNKE